MYEINDLIKKSRNDEAFTKEELVQMLDYPPDSTENYLMMAEARRISRELTNDQMEVHGQFAVNLAPCPKNCLFCSFAVVNKVFEKSSSLWAEQIVESALALEERGSSAVFMMTTAQYDFGLFVEMGTEVKKHLKPQTPLIANIGDRTPDEARRLKDAGFAGVYHAIRLREGIDTDIPPENRLKSFAAFTEAGLKLGTCVEPIGPEHTNEEIAEKILFTASLNPAYSGAGRRISIPGTKLAETYGMISELRMAQCVAVTRMAMPKSTPGNCTHEPCTLGAMAGASLFWAEVGANPRDTEEKTEEGRGAGPEKCREFFEEAGCGILNGPSMFYG